MCMHPTTLMQAAWRIENPKCEELEPAYCRFASNFIIVGYQLRVKKKAS